MIRRWYPYTALLLAGIGFGDAAYLTIQHFTQFTLPCSITQGCEVVTTSIYSSILGIPVALLGLLYYSAIVLAIYIATFEYKNEKALTIIALFTVLGFSFSLWFVYVQFFLLDAICQYCMISAFSSTALFGISVGYLAHQKTKIFSLFR
jgi:uncharacterized membrane protein